MTATTSHGAPGAGAGRPTRGDAHYFLDVDPDRLYAAGQVFAGIADQLAQRGTQISHTPAEIPTTSWAGSARTAICTEMTALGGQITRFVDHFHTAATTLTTLATSCREAQAEVTSLNRQRQAAQDAYAADLKTLQARQDHQTSTLSPAADPSMAPAVHKAALQDLTDSYAQAHTDATATRDTTTRALDGQFQHLVDQLRSKFRQASHALAAATIVAVPDATVSGFIAGGGTGMLPSWIGKDGQPFPPDLHAEAALGGIRLVTDQQQLLAGQAAADRFNHFFADGKTHSKAEIEAFLAGLYPDSAAFRQGFLAKVDPKTLLLMQQTAHYVGDEGSSREYGKVITSVAHMMAVGSNTGLQGDYPVTASFYRHWADIYEHTNPPKTGYILMAELVQAGQGDKATRDPALLVTLTRATITFEQNQTKANPNYVWTDPGGVGFLPTDAERNLTTNSAQIDPVAMMLDATSKDEGAAVALFTTTPTHPKAVPVADTALLHHLYDERAPLTGVYAVNGGPVEYGTVLGNVLPAATTTVGTGGRGTSEYVSAQIVSDVVDYYGSPDHKLWAGMEKPVVDMLCHHVQDVNAAFSDVQWTGDVHLGRADGPLPHAQLTVAVMDKEHVKDILAEAFGADYSGAGGSRPLFQQFTAVQTAAMKADFLTVSTIAAPARRSGLMQSIANDHGIATRLASDSLRDALVSHGVQADQANAEARAAASFVVGLATGGKVDAMNTAISSAVPGIPGKVAVLVAGKAVDGITTWAIDQVIPPTDHTGEMKAESARQETRLASTSSLAHLSWLDEARQLGPASPDAWAAAHPGQTGFLCKGTDGHWHFADLAVLRDQAKAGQRTINTAWNDFSDYWRDFGDPQLKQTDLYENYRLGLVTG